MPGSRFRGASRFEFAVCAILVALLAGTLLERIQHWREESERAAAYHVVGALHTALAARATQVATTRGQRAILVLTQENPMTWLARKPANYVGEYYAPDLHRMRRGVWFFDRTDKSINYVLGRDTFSRRPSNLLKFKVEFSRTADPASKNGWNGNPGVLVIEEIVTGLHN